jgi:molybdopterin/thiamine biosynthesis adenylyltransferase
MNVQEKVPTGRAHPPVAGGGDKPSSPAWRKGGEAGSAAPKAGSAALRVLIVGLGVVGLPLSLRLAQAGLSLLLCDFDRVEPGNLRKQLYDAAQVTSPKVVAAAELIRRHHPGADVEPLACDVRCFGAGFFLDLDLVAVCVDNLAAEKHCARLCNLTGKPYLRLATQGEQRIADVTFIGPPRTALDPCGICGYGHRDHQLASRRQSCMSDQEVNPEAGALTFAEHGTLAAAICADAVLRQELEPSRRVRFTGGVRPSLSVTELVFSPGCQLNDAPWSHGPRPWTVIGPAQSVRLKDVVSAAAETLGASGQELIVETDVPLCPERVCESCRLSYGPGFRRWSNGNGGARCERCGEPLRQHILPPAQRLDASQTLDLAHCTLAELDAPRGAGFRFAIQGGESFHVCAAV